MPIDRPVQRVNPVVIVFEIVVVSEWVEIAVHEAERNDNERGRLVVSEMNTAKSVVTILWKLMLSSDPAAHGFTSGDGMPIQI